MRSTVTAVVDDRRLESVTRPRRGVVAETPAGDGAFTADDGVVRGYRRSVTVSAAADPGTWRVDQTVSYEVAIPWFGWLFAPALRRRLSRIGDPFEAAWWLPPDRVDARAVQVLAALAAVSAVLGYLQVLLSQVITYAADEFSAGHGAQGVATAFVRCDALVALVAVARADRIGRRRALAVCMVAGAVLTATGALAPNLAALAVTQVGARGFLNAAAILVGIVAAEEVPAGSRAFAVSILAAAGSIGVGLCLLLLPVADSARWGWRLLFALGILGTPLARRVLRRLPETRRFATPHRDVAITTHGRRLWLLGAATLLLAVFVTPAAQFVNEYLRTERGYSGVQIALFTALTGIPGGIGLVAGGRLADRHGRRLIGALAVLVGVAATVVQFQIGGWPLWAVSVVGSVFGAAFVPALGVYGPELFPTSLRGRANGLITALGRVGSVGGLLAVGYLSRGGRSLGPAVASMAFGPALLVVLVLVAFPETAHRELEELNPEDAPPAS